jgi:thiol-disulfide isomerase/thioredoxin
MRARSGKALGALLGAAVALATGMATTEGLAQARPRGWLGIAMDDAGAGPGVRVGHVVRGSPADKAGIHENDRLLRVEGAQVASAPDVVRIVSAHADGDAVAITLSRSGKELGLSPTLASFPTPEEMLRMDLVGAYAPPFAGLEPLAGFPANLGSLRGRVVLVDFWASWCVPCRILSPVLSGWQAKYGAQGLSVVGVTTDPGDKAASAKDTFGMRYPVASDPHGETSKAYDVAALPTLFIIDKRGVIRDVAIGYEPGQDARVEALVKALLAEATPPN